MSKLSGKSRKKEKKPFVSDRNHFAIDFSDRVPARLLPDRGGEVGREVVRRQREVRDVDASQRSHFRAKSRRCFQSGKSLIRNP